MYLLLQVVILVGLIWSGPFITESDSRQVFLSYTFHHTQTSCSCQPRSTHSGAAWGQGPGQTRTQTTVIVPIWGKSLITNNGVISASPLRLFSSWACALTTYRVQHTVDIINCMALRSEDIQSSVVLIHAKCWHSWPKGISASLMNGFLFFIVIYVHLLLPSFAYQLIPCWETELICPVCVEVVECSCYQGLTLSRRP